MAMSGVIYGSRAVNSTGPRLELHWSVTSQSIANNTSTIKITSVLSMGGWISYDLTTSGSTTAQGTTKTYSYTPTSATALTRTMATTYHTVKHSDDGTLTLTLAGEHTLRNFTWSGSSVGTISASQSITIDKIIRGIDLATIKLASGFNAIEGAKTITFTALSSTATVKIYMRYYNGNTGNWSSHVTISSSYTSGGSISIPSATQQAMYSATPAEYSTIYTIWRVEVYQGGSLIQTEELGNRFTLQVLPPDITLTVTCTGTNQVRLSSSTRAVQGVHYVEAKTTATPKNGASIKSYSYSFQGVTYSGSILKQLITKTGTLPVKVTVTDSRGGQASKTVNIVSVAYKKPNLSGLKVARYDGAEESPIGATWKATGSIAFTDVKNANGESCNSPWWNFDAASKTYNSAIIQSGSLAIENTKTMTLYFGDSFTTTSKIAISIPRGELPFAIGQKGIGVGTMPPEAGEGLWIKGQMVLNNKQRFITRDITSQVTIKDAGVTNLKAYTYGNIVFLNFYYKPTQAGWSPTLLTLPNSLRQEMTISASVGSIRSSEDIRNNRYSAYLYLKNGNVFAVGDTSQAELIYTFIYIATGDLG